MKPAQKLAALSFLSALLAFSSHAAEARDTQNFDADWLFLQSDASGAEQITFDDSAWRKLDLPHDWSIEGPFAETNKTGGSAAFLPAGMGWYRKHFTLPQSDSGQSVSIEFDGVMANSDVWINGFNLGHRPYGYVGLDYELTGHLNFGGDNVIAVRCDDSVQPASRFYAGAGIYRHVRLVAADPVHIEHNGVFITTPEIHDNDAKVNLHINVDNSSASNVDLMVKTVVYELNPDGEKGRIVRGDQFDINGLAAGTSRSADTMFDIEKPKLWDIDSPNLYVAVTQLRRWQTPNSSSVETLDSCETVFGIRDAHFEADTGFWLNGKNFKVKGVCVHEDGGAFGMAVPISVWQDRLATLKTLGVNAIRTAHNPPAPEFLDLCDRMGFLVMDEMFDCWTVGKSGLDGARLADYHLYFNDWSKIDVADTVRRDRNHPSIILYSAGNEIHDTPNAELAKNILSGLVAVFHTNDPTRPVTQALFRPNASHDYDDGLADLLDVVGQNYREQEILAAHEQNPARKIIGTENTHTRQQWVAMRDHPPYAGQFLWTGVDYLGESRRWPLVGHGSGLLDRTGAFRPVAFERQSWWSDRPMVAIVRRAGQTEAMPTDPGYAADERYSQVLFADWTPRNPQPHNENVEIYSNCKEVELFLNGQSLGKKEINADASPRNWTVTYAPGVLRAVATDENGQVVATTELRTAGKPAKIVLTTDAKNLAPGFENVAVVRAKIVDAKGIEVPRANDLISFHISGPGAIADVDNADNSSHEPFQAASRHAFQGRCVAFVRATAASGKITLAATADGLSGGSVTLKASPELSR